MGGARRVVLRTGLRGIVRIYRIHINSCKKRRRECVRFPQLSSKVSQSRGLPLSLITLVSLTWGTSSDELPPPPQALRGCRQVLALPIHTTDFWLRFLADSSMPQAAVSSCTFRTVPTILLPVSLRLLLLLGSSIVPSSCTSSQNITMDFFKASRRICPLRSGLVP